MGNRGKIILLMLLTGCSRSTGVRVQLSLEDGAPTPDSIAVSIYDRFGGIAYSVPLEPRLPGDLLVLVSIDSEFVRVVGRGELNGAMVVGGVAATAVESGKEMPLPMLLSSQLPADRDGDGVPDVVDDCPDRFDPDQTDTSGAMPGDACPNLAPPYGTDLGTKPGKPDLSTGGAPDLAPPDLLPVTPVQCGDGLVQAGEACDDGSANSDDPQVAASCTSACQKRAGCGNLAGSSGAQINPASGHCYVAWPNLVNWATASRLCEAHGGHLAVVTSASENARIQSLAGLSDRWLGLEIDHGQKVRDHWVNGEAVAYTNYAATEPNNGGSSGDPEACGVFESMRAAWDDRPCGFPETGDLPYSLPYTLGYICENECGNGVVDPGEGCDTAGAGCTATCQSVRACGEAGAVNSPVNGHCYFTLATPLVFSDALSACPAGTHLATLDEIAESEAASLAVAGNDAWIALRAAATQGAYAWTVGSDFFDSRRYHGFAATEPNDTVAPPLCARMTSQGWKDRACNLGYVPLCERE